MKKRDFRKLSKEAQAEVRRAAVFSYLSAGKMTKSAIAKMFEVTNNTVKEWIDEYERCGSKSFAKDKRGAKKFQNTSLTKQQLGWLKKQLVKKTPEQFEFPFMLWTRGLVVELVKKKYGIEISLSTAGEYLKNFGMTSKKPVLRSYAQQPESIKKWLDEEYPKILARSIQEGSKIFWGDETGIRSRDQVGKGYSLKGKKPVQKQGGYRFGVNMISAINNGGESRFMVFGGKMNSRKFIEFLRRLTKNQKHKIILVVDNAAFHKSVQVRNWVQKHSKKIELQFLPTYTPELNPDEYLNNALKQKLIRKPKASTPSQLTKIVTSIMKGMQSSTTAIKNLFQHELVRYAA